MTDPVDVLILGRLYSDLIFAGVSAPSPGAEVFADQVVVSPGAAANHAVTAARLGASTAMLVEISDDPISAIVEGMLRGEPNLDLGACVRRTGEQGSISVSITDGFERSFISYSMPARSVEWRRDAPRTAYAGLTESIPSWLSAARGEGTVVFSGGGWDPSGQWDPAMLDRLRDVDGVILNEVEALKYTRASTVDAALDILAEYVDLAIVTMGEAGAAAAHDGERIRVPAVPVEAVDPTGAGDAFAGAMLVATAWGWPIEDRLRLASAVSACVVSKPGGARAAPRPAEIDALLTQSGFDSAWTRVALWARSAAESSGHEAMTAAPRS